MQKMPPELGFVPPMECKEVKRIDDIPRGDEWQYEIKFDGYRGIAIKQHNEVRIFSRNGNLLTQFPNLYEAIGKLPRKSFILDGEIVGLDENGKSNFNALQRSKTRRIDVHFYAFDLLHLEGEDLMKLPLHERQKQMFQNFSATDFIHPSAPLDADLDDIIKNLRQIGFEGVIAKRRESIYLPGKIPGTWIKKKLKQTDQFIIGGFIPGITGVDEILIGEFSGKDFRFIEDIDDGFIPATRRKVYEAIKKLETDKCPFQNLTGSQARKHLDKEKLEQAHWIKPKVTVEVAFNERTPNNHLRHGEFVRLLKIK